MLVSVRIADFWVLLNGFASEFGEEWLLIGHPRLLPVQVCASSDGQLSSVVSFRTSVRIVGRGWGLETSLDCGFDGLVLGSFLGSFENRVRYGLVTIIMLLRSWCGPSDALPSLAIGHPHTLFNVAHSGIL